MKTKYGIFKSTFVILSIMCCLLIGSTSIIYALNRISINEKVETAASNAKTTASVSSTLSSSDTTVLNAADTSSASAGSSDADESASSTKTESTTTDSTGNNSNNAGNDTLNDPSEDTTDNSSSEPAGETSGETPANNTDQNDSTGTQTPPVQTPSETPIPLSVTISAVGDIMAHQGNLNNAYNPITGLYDFKGFLEYVKPYLSKSDITIGNFETVTAGPATGYTSYPSFNTPDSILTALSWGGFDVLSTANNHCLDRGANGLTSTIQKIFKNKMVNVGSSVNGKNKYIVKEINGIKLGILAYSGLYNGNDRRLKASQINQYLNPLNEAQMQKDIKAIKSAGTDAVIVIVHWGTEYQRTPSTLQTSLSKKIINWGADIILGSHPHVIQKSEIVKVAGKNKFIIYSMGNFISGYRSVDKANRPNKLFTEDGVVVNLQIEKDPKKGTIIKDISYLPTWVDKYYINNRPVFKVIPISGADMKAPYINSRNKTSIKRSYNNTMEIMAKMK